MGSNIIAHLIFFFYLHTFYTLIFQLPHILKSWNLYNHCHTFGSSFSTFLHFPVSFCFFISLSLSLSHEYVHSVLSLQHCHRMPILQWLIIKLLWIEYLHVQEARLVNKKKKKKSLNWSSRSLQICLSLGFFASS